MEVVAVESRCRPCDDPTTARLDRQRSRRCEVKGDVDDHVFLPANELSATHLGENVTNVDAVAQRRIFGAAQEAGVDAGVSEGESLLTVNLDGAIHQSQRAIGDTGRSIGLAAGILCNVLNPQRIATGGELASANEFVLDPLKESLQRGAVKSAADDVQVVVEELGGRAVAMGAVGLVLRSSTGMISRRRGTGVVRGLV